MVGLYIVLREVDENDDWVIPTEEELQEFVDSGDEEIGPSNRSKTTVGRWGLWDAYEEREGGQVVEDPFVSVDSDADIEKLFVGIAHYKFACLTEVCKVLARDY